MIEQPILSFLDGVITGEKTNKTKTNFSAQRRVNVIVDKNYQNLWTQPSCQIDLDPLSSFHCPALLHPKKSSDLNSCFVIPPPHLMSSKNPTSQNTLIPNVPGAVSDVPTAHTHYRVRSARCCTRAFPTSNFASSLHPFCSASGTRTEFFRFCPFQSCNVQRFLTNQTVTQGERRKQRLKTKNSAFWLLRQCWRSLLKRNKVRAVASGNSCCG